MLSALTLVALVLVCGAIVQADVTKRRIPNALCLCVGLLALVHAMATGGWAGVVDLACQGGVAVLVAVPLTVLFVMRRIGGGDVKLIVAMLLWVPLEEMPLMMAVTVLVGMAMAVVLKLLDRLFCLRAQTVPYGVAIVAGGLAVLAMPLVSLTTAFVAEACVAMSGFA